MKKAIIISALGHAALIALLAMKLPFLTRETEVIEEEFVPVELVEHLEEVAKAPPPPPREEPQPEEKPVEEQQQAAVEPEPTPPDDAVPLPEPEKKPKEAQKPEPKTPAASPKRKPTPPSRFSASRIAALLDKSVDQEAPATEAPKKPFDAAKLLERPQRSALETAQMAASLRSLIRSQVEPCWSVPAGARGAEELQVKIRIYLLPNGALARAPEIVDSARMYAPGQEFFRVAAESARRAIQRCAPLKLPADTYDIWRETELIFDPKEMLGG